MSSGPTPRRSDGGGVLRSGVIAGAQDVAADVARARP